LTDRELYAFDTRGFLVERDFISAEECSAIEAVLEPHWDDADPQDPVQRIDDVAALPLVSELLDATVSRSGIYDTLNQPFRLIESYALRRGKGSTQPLHNGRSNVNRSARGVSHLAMWREHTYHDGLVYCMMVKVLVYLSDISTPEDGPFVVVEGSHKANYPYPYPAPEMQAGAGLEEPGTEPVYTRAGDLLLLNEALTHGSRAKATDGYRGFVAFSFAPSFVADYEALPDDSLSLVGTGFCE
jgi:hypothetical protein